MDAFINLFKYAQQFYGQKVEDQAHNLKGIEPCAFTIQSNLFKQFEKLEQRKILLLKSGFNKPCSKYYFALKKERQLPSGQIMGGIWSFS